MARPIQFSIPSRKVINHVPEKRKDFASIIPGAMQTYVYWEEADYYRDYQDAYFGITGMKQGWDCMRHYEILANGCVPYFDKLKDCPPDTIKHLPKELIAEASRLPGVSRGFIDHAIFDQAGKTRYFEILTQLLQHTRDHLTSRRSAERLLTDLGYGGGQVLYLSQDQFPDYLRCTTLVGLKESLGGDVVDVPKIEHIYEGYHGDIKDLYGRGFTYTRNVPDVLIDRERIEKRIEERKFAVVIYGSVHRGMPYLDLVRRSYPPDKVGYLCGEDAHHCEYSQWPNLFLRESSSYRP